MRERRNFSEFNEGPDGILVVAYSPSCPGKDRICLFIEYFIPNPYRSVLLRARVPHGNRPEPEILQPDLNPK